MLFNLILGLVLVILGCTVGSLLTYIYFAKSSNNIKKEAEQIKVDAQLKAERLKKENVLEMKEEAHLLKLETEKYIKERKVEILDLEDKLTSRENGINKREELLFAREKMIEQKDSEIKKGYETLKDKELIVDQALAKQEKILEEISQYTVQEAREIIMEDVKNQMSKEIMTFVRQQEEEAQDVAKKRSQEIILTAMERYAATVTNEATISVVTLPDDEIKGRIIGREGRNIKAIESLTGVDLIIDDTPEAVVLSCFDPVRREIARLTLERLIADGRIHPGKIEESYLKSKSEMDEKMIEYGEEAIFDLGLGRVAPELIKILGRLHFRTSYGQNVLKHSKEVAFLSGLIAAELGLDVKLARRAGLFHDIGKAIDHEVEGSHVDLGVELAKKYKENDTVINAIASHHGNTAPTSSISVIVAICDTLSAARPGARSESIENYIQRIRDLETICKEFKGIENAFAIQAGREVRVIVNPTMHDDLTAHQVARDIKDKIENELKYPGIIKVNVIRETRFVEEAK